MALKCPGLLPIGIVSDDPYLAARLSSALAQRGSYLAVMDGPRMQRPDCRSEVIRRNNAIARLSAEMVLLGGLPQEAQRAMEEQLPEERTYIVCDELVPHLVMDERIRDAEPLRWGTNRIGLGLLKALYERRLIEFTDEPSPAQKIWSRSGHLVICEEGEPLSEVIAANYAYSLGASLHLVGKTDEVESRELLEAYYSIDQPGSSPPDTRRRLRNRFLELCGDIDLPKEGSLTFITRSLPLGVAFPELPSTHLFQYPDLGISIVNGFAAEQKGTRGVNVAVVVDPEKVRAPEIEAARKLLPKRRIFLRGYTGKVATVRAVSDMMELFPYDLLIFATHCGDASGYRWTYKFADSEGIDRALVVDIALGIGQSEDKDLFQVMKFVRFHSLDGVDWTDPAAKAELYVGTAIKDFAEFSKDDGIEPVEKQNIPRVIGSAAMAMADNNMIVMPRSLAAEGSPIIINNACVSWHDLASRLTFTNARAYIGTLFPVSDLEAEAIVVRLLDQEFGKYLPHAIWRAQRATYGAADDRRPYVMTGVYTQKLRVTAEHVTLRILRHLKAGRRHWKARLDEATAAGDERGKKDFAEMINFYEKEIVHFRSRWLDVQRQAKRPSK